MCMDVAGQPFVLHFPPKRTSKIARPNNLQLRVKLRMSSLRNFLYSRVNSCSLGPNTAARLRSSCSGNSCTLT